MEKKRRRRKRDRFYFSSETQDAIIAYNGTENCIERNRLYEDIIHYSFDKLAENMINVTKVKHFGLPFNDLKHEVVVFLLKNIDKYDVTKGKAFSYFTVIAKNYLIQNDTILYKKNKKMDDLDILDTNFDVDAEVMELQNNFYSKELVSIMVPFLEGRVPYLFTKQRDRYIADCVLELFKNIDSVENFDRKAIYLILREKTMATTQQITRVINQLREHYSKVRGEYNETGEIKSVNFFMYE